MRQLLEERAREEPVPPDWCYVYNFGEPRRPRRLKLPPCRGAQLRRDMEQLVEELGAALPAAFESEEYQTRKQLLEKQLEQRH